ncbi:MAG: HAD-IA family hydrolase [Parvibaculum sp.]
MRALMIDVDGVVIRGRPKDGRPWSSRLADDLGLDAEELQREFFRPHWDAVVTGKSTLHDRLAPVLARIASGLSCEDLIAYWFENDARIDRRLLQEIDALRAQGLRACLATNQEHARAAYLMDRLGLAKHFDGIYYSADLGHQKPDAAFFQKVEKAVGIPGECLLLIDDSSANIDAARRMGWKASCWTGEDRLAELVAI